MQFTLILQAQSFESWTVDGQLGAQVKNAGTFSYIQIYGAGHEVPAYKVCLSRSQIRFHVLFRSLVAWHTGNIPEGQGGCIEYIIGRIQCSLLRKFSIAVRLPSFKHDLGYI